MVSFDYKNAKNTLLTDFDKNCQQFFVKNGYILENAYCELLNDNLNEAKKQFLLIQNNDIRAHWGLILISLIEGDVREYPSYFEIRNFLEIDLNILMKYLKGDYIEKIVRYSDFLYTINPEVYKFVGRVFYNNGFEDLAMYFLNKAKNYFYNDPELHYLLAYINFEKKDYITTKKHAQDCLRILPNYYPAKKMLENIDISSGLC